MTHVLFALLLVPVGAAAAYLAVQAFRSEHLVAFRHRHRDIFLFEREGDGRYRLIGPVQVPLAVYHFAVLRCVAAVKAGSQAVLHRLPGHLQRDARRASAAHA